MHALTHCTLYTGRDILEDYAVVIDKKRIADIVKATTLPSDMNTEDMHGAILTPGFIDLQINGCGGRLFNDHICAETLDTMCRTMLPTGCTGFLPALISTSDTDMTTAMKVVQDYREHARETVLGLHLEGPWLNLERRGIHDPGMIRPPDEDMLALIKRYGNKVVRMCTLAPEQVQQHQIEQLNHADIRISAGHSSVYCSRAREMFRQNIHMATHLFNAMEPLKGREPGLLGAVFLEKPWTGIIADGVHVAWENIILAKEILGEKLFLVTDATPAVRSDITHFEFGGQRVYVKEGKCVTEGGTIGGSLLTMDQAVRNCVAYAGVEPAEALRMASLYPAQALGMDTEYGRIGKGYQADLVALDQQLEVVSVFKKGECLYA